MTEHLQPHPLAIKRETNLRENGFYNYGGVRDLYVAHERGLVFWIDPQSGRQRMYVDYNTSFAPYSHVIAVRVARKIDDDGDLPDAIEVLSVHGKNKFSLMDYSLSGSGQHIRGELSMEKSEDTSKRLSELLFLSESPIPLQLAASGVSPEEKNPQIWTLKMDNYGSPTEIIAVTWDDDSHLNLIGILKPFEIVAGEDGDMDYEVVSATEVFTYRVPVEQVVLRKKSGETVTVRGGEILYEDEHTHFPKVEG